MPTVPFAAFLGEGFYLLVKANITEMGSTGDKVSSKYTAEDGFTFVSSNDDKLAVNKETGELYPPKNAANGTVGIHVYYKNPSHDSPR